MAEQELLAEALAVRAGRKVELRSRSAARSAQLVENALTNARQALARRLADTRAAGAAARAAGRAASTCRPAPARIEVYDNSHIQGKDAIGAFIVAGPEGFDKQSYRTFNIKGADLDARRRLRDDARGAAAPLRPPGQGGPGAARGGWPDLVVIDGGAGQLAAAQATVAELGLVDVPLMAVAKGPDRDAGRERFFMPGREPLQLDPRDPVLYFVQRLRDEAHRFAINDPPRQAAPAPSAARSLDQIPGIGGKRKRALARRTSARPRVWSRRASLTSSACRASTRRSRRTIHDYFHDGG